MVFLLWSLGHNVSKKVERLRLAERRLIEHAKDFVVAVVPAPSCSSPEIRTADVEIPRSVIPLLFHKDDVHQNHDNAETYVIHGVEIHNNTLNNDDDDLKNNRNNKSKTPLVLLHGYMNGCLYFYRNFYGLSRYFESIYSLDLLGWGLSSRPRFAALKDGGSRETAEAFFVESLEAWRKAQGVDKMILAGHSMGGYVSVAYTEKYPQHVERLVLISPAGVPEQHNDQTVDPSKPLTTTQWMQRRLWNHLYTYSSVGDLLRALPSSYAMDRIRSYVRFRVGTDESTRLSIPEQEALSDYLYHCNALPGSGEYCISRFLTPRIVYGKAPTVHRIPHLDVGSVSFIYGDHDWMDPVQGGLAVQKACQLKQQYARSPNVSVHIVPKAGHLLMLDHWQAFNRQLVIAAGLDLLPDEHDDLHRKHSVISGPKDRKF